MSERPNSILVVDDEDVVTQTIRSFLSLETNYDVHTFESPNGALDALKERSFDVVISDFLMPEMNGLEFLSEVKSRHPDSVRILLTGYADKQNAVRAINEVGLFQYIEKPWDNEQLLLVIRNGLAQRTLNQRLDEKINELDSVSREKERIVQAHDELREELSLARRVQESLLPGRFPSVDSVRFAAAYHPAIEVGGDFYDVIPLADDHIGLLVADATGHGIQAALSTTLIKHAFGEFAGAKVGPDEILARMNEALHRVLPPDVFVAATVVTIPPPGDRLVVAGGGNPHPYVVRRASERIDTVSANGLLLGVVEPSAYQHSEPVDVDLSGGDKLVLVTDGITEAKNGGGADFGEAGLCDALAAARKRSGDELCGALVEGARQFSGEDHEWDDITVLVVEKPH